MKTPDGRAPSSRKENPTEAIPVSEKFLRELFSSKEFISLLAKARKGMQGHVRMHGFRGFEHGFGMIKSLGGDEAYFTNVVAQTTGVDMEDADSISIGPALSEVMSKWQEKFPKKKFVRFGDLHFHPEPVEPDPVIVPSGLGDLKSSFATRKFNQENAHYDFPSLNMVAQMTSDGETKILVYQEPLSHSPLTLPVLDPFLRTPILYLRIVRRGL